MLDTSADGPFVTGKVRLIHAAGMHARPAVKLTKLAKRFQAQIFVRASEAADWTNAKSVAKVMASSTPLVSNSSVGWTPRCAATCRSTLSRSG